MSLAASLPARWQARVPRRVTRRARRVGKKHFSSFGGTHRPPLSRASSSSPGEADVTRGEADAPASAPATSRFFAGVGVGDCTGPMDGVGMMGYARLSQISTGLRQRQKARAFVVAETRPTFLRRRDAASLNSSKRDDAFDEDDDAEDDDDFDDHLQKERETRSSRSSWWGARMVFPTSSPRFCVASGKNRVAFGANEEDAQSVFDEANVCVCATHTHSAPGGYAPHGLYNLTFGGPVSESFEALARGAADALFAAFADAFCETSETEPKRTVAFARGALVGASANRSRSAHARNPEADTAPFVRAGGVDETIVALVVGAHDQPDELDEIVGVGEKKKKNNLKKAFVPRGVAAWYAVHGTSLPGSNTLISGDNKGIASSLTESALRSAAAGDDSAVTALVSLFETLRETETRADRGLADAGAVAAAAAAAARVATSGFERAFLFDVFEVLEGRNATDRPGPVRRVVAAFPQSASGDVSPNVLGAFDAFGGARCDGSEATRGVLGFLGKKPRVADCVGAGPNGTGDDTHLSCLVTGTAQAAACVSLLRGATTPVSGPVRAAARWVPIGREGGVATNVSASGNATATPALGYSFAAGTTDGPGENGFGQGDREEERRETNGNGKRNTKQKQKQKQRFLGRVATFVFGGARTFGVSEETREAHRPKPVLVAFDEPRPRPRRGSTEGLGYPSRRLGWVQRDVQVQVFRLGNVLIVSVPAEVTTVAGRRLARAAARAARDAEDLKNSATSSWSVVVNGLANGYSGYVTTEREYGEQRYEGASGLYGPNTLRLYERVVAELARELVAELGSGKKKNSSRVERTLAGAEADPRAYDEFRLSSAKRTRDGPQSFVPPFDARWPPWARFGDVLRGPARFGTTQFFTKKKKKKKPSRRRARRRRRGARDVFDRPPASVLVASPPRDVSGRRAPRRAPRPTRVARRCGRRRRVHDGRVGTARASVSGVSPDARVAPARRRRAGNVQVGRLRSGEVGVERAVVFHSRRRKRKARGRAGVLPRVQRAVRSARGERVRVSSNAIVCLYCTFVRRLYASKAHAAAARASALERAARKSADGEDNVLGDARRRFRYRRTLTFSPPGL